MSSSTKGSPGKKLINSKESCVDDFLTGFVAANNCLRLVRQHRIVVRSDYGGVVAADRVTVICGGGSGHEPAFAGYVGYGMLTAAVAGPVFAAPPVAAIFNAIRLVGSKSPTNGGTLVIVPNYTGDKLNFGLAIEKAKLEGYKVDFVTVGEDCALLSTDKSAGRRGLAGLMLTIKVAGAMAEKGTSLNDIVSSLHKFIPNLGTIGLCLKECSIPGCNPSFVLNDEEIELGLGAHGEAGVARIPLASAKESVSVMFSRMTSEQSASSLTLNKGDKVVLLINNLGATTTLEMGIMASEAIAWLQSRQVQVLRVFMGHVMTSLEMAGVAFTVLKSAQLYLEFLDAETKAVAWPKGQQLQSTNETDRISSIFIPLPDFEMDSLTNKEAKAVLINQSDAALVGECIRLSCVRLMESREELNSLDRRCGDGDTGNTLHLGAEAVLKALEASLLSLDCPQQTFSRVSDLCQTMGGTCGAIFGIFFAAACSAFTVDFSVRSWAEGVRVAVAAITKHSGAEAGDRTLLDPLDEVLKAWNDLSQVDGRKAAELAAAASELGAKKTVSMKAKAGRASYVPQQQCDQMDPGARAVAIITQAVSETLTKIAK